MVPNVVNWRHTVFTGGPFHQNTKDKSSILNVNNNLEDLWSCFFLTYRKTYGSKWPMFKSLFEAPLVAKYTCILLKGYYPYSYQQSRKNFLFPQYEENLQDSKLYRAYIFLDKQQLCLLYNIYWVPFPSIGNALSLCCLSRRKKKNKLSSVGVQINHWQNCWYISTDASSNRGPGWCSAIFQAHPRGGPGVIRWKGRTLAKKQGLKWHLFLLFWPPGILCDQNTLFVLPTRTKPTWERGWNKPSWNSL